MKKLILSFAAIILCAICVNAQKSSMHGGSSFSISGNVGPATTSDYTIAFGGNLQAAFPVASGLDLTASAGYENFSYSINFGTGTVKGHSSYIPLLGGAKFFLSPKFYGHGELGYSISTVSGGKGAFTYSPKLGYVISPNLDFAVQYLALSYSGATLSAVLASLRVNFGGK